MPECGCILRVGFPALPDDVSEICSTDPGRDCESGIIPLLYDRNVAGGKEFPDPDSGCSRSEDEFPWVDRED